jgi:hypothetical protein
MASSNPLGGSNFRESALISIKSYPAITVLSSGSGYAFYPDDLAVLSPGLDRSYFYQLQEISFGFCC